MLLSPTALNRERKMDTLERRWGRRRRAGRGRGVSWRQKRGVDEEHRSRWLREKGMCLDELSPYLYLLVFVPCYCVPLKWSSLLSGIWTSHTNPDLKGKINMYCTHDAFIKKNICFVKKKKQFPILIHVLLMGENQVLMHHSQPKIPNSRLIWEQLKGKCDFLCSLNIYVQQSYCVTGPIRYFSAQHILKV